jgi:hypothetical protein
MRKSRSQSISFLDICLILVEVAGDGRDYANEKWQ